MVESSCTPTAAAFGARLEVRAHGAGALFRRAVCGGRGGEAARGWGRRRYPRDRAAAAGVAPFTPHDKRRTSLSERAWRRRRPGDGSNDGRSWKRDDDGWLRPSWDAARGKAADLVHVPFFPRQAW